MHIQPFLSVVLTLKRDSLAGRVFSHSCQWFWSAQELERDSLSGCVQPFLSVVLICSDTEEGLTSWMYVQVFLSVDLICSNTREGLTCWMHVQPFLSVILICSNTQVTHKLDTFSAILVSGSDLLKHWSNSLPVWMFIPSHQWFWSAQTLKNNSLSGCIAILVSGSDLLKYWSMTHILDIFSIYFVSKIHVHHLQSYQSFLQKHLSDLNNLCKGMPHTYCQHSISLLFTKVCTHFLNSMSISDVTSKGHNWFHIALFVLSQWHSSEINFKRWWFSKLTSTYKFCIDTHL